MYMYRSRIHEHTVSLRFLLLRVLRLEVSVYNVYIKNQFQTTFAQGGGGVNLLSEVTVNSMGKL
jgi:hypothetical protein